MSASCSDYRLEVFDPCPGVVLSKEDVTTAIDNVDF